MYDMTIVLQYDYMHFANNYVIYRQSSLYFSLFSSACLLLTIVIRQVSNYFGFACPFVIFSNSTFSTHPLIHIRQKQEFNICLLNNVYYQDTMSKTDIAQCEFIPKRYEQQQIEACEGDRQNLRKKIRT